MNGAARDAIDDDSCDATDNNNNNYGMVDAMCDAIDDAIM